MQNYNPKSSDNTVTTARLLLVARACQGSHFEMPQQATVARALRLITESTGVVSFCQCLTLRTDTGRSEGGAGMNRAAACLADGKGTACCEASDQRVVVRLVGVEGSGIARAAAVTQKGIVLISPARSSKRLLSLDSMGNTQRSGFCSTKKNLRI